MTVKSAGGTGGEGRGVPGSVQGRKDQVSYANETLAYSSTSNGDAKREGLGYGWARKNECRAHLDEN